MRDWNGSGDYFYYRIFHKPVSRYKTWTAGPRISGELSQVIGYYEHGEAEREKEKC